MPSTSAANSSPVWRRFVTARHECTSVPLAAPSVSYTPNLTFVLPTSMASSTLARPSQREHAIQDDASHVRFARASDVFASAARPQDARFRIVRREADAVEADPVDDDAVQTLALQLLAAAGFE